jgi:hypothetical protein
MKLSPTEIFNHKKIFFIGDTGFVGKSFLLVLMTFLFASAIYACQPAVPLGQLALFPGAIAKSAYLLIATVILKCAAFCFFERSIIWWKAFSLLFIANIVTTIIGFLAVLPTHAVPACLPSFIFTYALCLLPSDGLAKKYFSAKKQKIAQQCIALLLTIFSFLSMFFSIGAVNLVNEGKRQNFFIAALISICFGLLFGIILTIFYEDWIITKLTKRTNDTTPFLTSVSRANYVALLFMIIVTGIIIIPERIKTEFLSCLLIK